MKALILHSDDLGFSADANRRIFSAFDDGLLSSASIMVNMPGSLSALKSAAGIKGRFGLHLNLTEGFPLAEAVEIPQLVCESAAFSGPLRLALLLSRSGINLSLRRQWRREIELQFQKAFDNGLIVSHVNGHHYIETFPFLREDILSFCSRYGVRNLRVACDPTPLRIFMRYAFRPKLLWALWIKRNAAALRREAGAGGFSFPEVTLGVGLSGRLVPELIDFWLRNYVAVGRGKAEIISHVGCSEQNFMLERLCRKQFADERKTLLLIAERRSDFLELVDYSTDASRNHAQ